MSSKIQGLPLCPSDSQTVGQETASAGQLLLRDEWYTPDSTYLPLEREFGPFDLDACASALNAKCRTFYTVEDDARSKPWRGRVWCNPPYKNLIQWVKKAWAEVECGNADLVVMLLPSHTSTEWFHFALEHGAIRFLKGRVKFGGSAGTPFWGSIVVTFRRAA